MSMAAAALATFSAAIAHAQSGTIIYVDADSSNTVQALPIAAGDTGSYPVSAGLGAALPSMATGGDAGVNQWWFRPGFGLSSSISGGPTPATWSQPTPNGTVLEASGPSGPENVPRLATTVTGLPAGSYEVFAFYWDQRGLSDWGIRASLQDTAGILLYFGSGLPGEMPTSTPSGEVTTDSASRFLLRASLGLTAPESTSITVYIDDLPGAAANGFQRTWYDGIGYRLVPEPTSGMLAVCGAVVARRRPTRRRFDSGSPSGA
jgi:hypothetical protein